MRHPRRARRTPRSSEGWAEMRVTAVILLVGMLARGAAAGKWPTYAGGEHRLFFNPRERTITPQNVAKLRVKWTFHTAAPVTASPSVAEVDVPKMGRTQVAFVQSWD